MFVTRPVPLKIIRRPEEENYFRECGFQELNVNGLRSVMFTENSESPLLEDGSYTGDLVPITFPPGITRFMKPDSEVPSDYLPSAAPPGTYVPVDPLAEERATSVYLTNCLTIREGPIGEDQVFQQNLYGNHACDDDFFMAENGKTCSRLSRSPNSGLPLVFHLRMPLKDEKRALGFPQMDIDHFLLPTILPNLSVLWVAIPNRDKDDGSKNMEAIRRWLGSSTAVISSGKCYFIDEAEIMVTMEKNQDGDVLAKLVA